MRGGLGEVCGGHAEAVGPASWGRAVCGWRVLVASFWSVCGGVGGWILVSVCPCVSVQVYACVRTARAWGAEVWLPVGQEA